MSAEKNKLRDDSYETLTPRCNICYTFMSYLGIAFKHAMK